MTDRPSTRRPGNDRTPSRRPAARRGAEPGARARSKGHDRAQAVLTEGTRSEQRAKREEQRRRARRRVLWPLLGVATLVGVLVLGVYPARTWMNQRASLGSAEARLHTLEERNQQMREEIAGLQTPEEIERLARRDYNLVRPGEEAYAVLPARTVAIDIPPTWPFTQLAVIVGS